MLAYRLAVKKFDIFFIADHLLGAWTITQMIECQLFYAQIEESSHCDSSIPSFLVTENQNTAKSSTYENQRLSLKLVSFLDMKRRFSFTGLMGLRRLSTSCILKKVNYCSKVFLEHWLKFVWFHSLFITRLQRHCRFVTADIIAN